MDSAHSEGTAFRWIGGTKKHGDSSEVMKDNILLQGYPGVGKTTVVKKIVAGVESAGGFYTEEIREGSTRRGFKIITLEGNQGILAYEGRPSPYRVGKYGVNIEVLESVGVESISDSLEDMGKRLIIIDEIGKMELFSSRFQDVVMEALDSPKTLLATVPMKSNVFVKKLKLRQRFEVITVTADNRDSLPDQVLGMMEKA